MKLSDKVTIVARPAASADAYGNDSVDWATATRRTVTGALQPVTSTENADDRQATVSSHTLYLPPSTAITTVDRVELDGATYEVAGEPQIWRARGQVHHLTVPLQRIAA